ncbi:MAG: TRAP transporter TatT component family protein, partial [Candidatus Bipolaricaulota bacterium]
EFLFSLPDMNNSKKLKTCMSFFVLLLLLIPDAGLTGEEGGLTEDTRLQDLIRKADRVAKEARTENRTEERLWDAIGLYRDILEVDPENRHALNRLSLGYFTLAEAYVEEPEKKKTYYAKGYEYGLKSLKFNEEFAELYGDQGFEALKNLPETVEDVEAVFWTGANLGRLGETKGILDSLGDLPALVALNRRAVSLDETYLGGGAHRALGSIGGELLGRRPVTIMQINKYDLSWGKAKKHFERAIELAPNCLENYFSYAKYYALKRGKKGTARDLLDEVLESPVGEEYPLINKIAKEKARKLKQERF